MITQLAKFNTLVSSYYKTTNPTGEQLTVWMKDMASILFYLTTEQIKAHVKWNSLMYNRGNASVASQTVIANEQVPELYQLRKIIHAGYKELDVLRSSLSYLKSEKTNT